MADLISQNPGSSLLDAVLEEYPDAATAQTKGVLSPPGPADDVREFTEGTDGGNTAPGVLTPAGVMAGYRQPLAKDAASHKHYDGASVVDKPGLLENLQAVGTLGMPALERNEDPELWVAQTFIIPSGANNICLAQYDAQRYSATIVCVSGTVIISPERNVMTPVGGAANFVGNGILMGTAAPTATVRGKVAIYATEASGAGSATVTVNIARYAM